MLSNIIFILLFFFPLSFSTHAIQSGPTEITKTYINSVSAAHSKDIRKIYDRSYYEKNYPNFYKTLPSSDQSDQEVEDSAEYKNELKKNYYLLWPDITINYEKNFGKDLIYTLKTEVRRSVLHVYAMGFPYVLDNLKIHIESVHSSILITSETLDNNKINTKSSIASSFQSFGEKNIDAKEQSQTSILSQASTRDSFGTDSYLSSSIKRQKSKVYSSENIDDVSKENKQGKSSTQKNIEQTVYRLHITESCIKPKKDFLDNKHGIHFVISECKTYCEFVPSNKHRAFLNIRFTPFETPSSMEEWVLENLHGYIDLFTMCSQLEWRGANCEILLNQSFL